MVGVDESRRHETIRGVDDDVSVGFLTTIPDVRNQSMCDRNVPAGNLSPLFVNRRNERCVANEEVSSCVQPLSSTSSLPSWRISASR